MSKTNAAVTVEILLKQQQNTGVSNDDFYRSVANYINSLGKIPKLILSRDIDNELVKSLVDEITINGNVSNQLDVMSTQFVSYNVFDHRPEMETIENGDSSEDVSASSHWLLPNREFQGLWESLIYQHGLKENILQFAKTIMLFSQRNINVNIIACNKLVLLHGPPGTGKTSLCKALAQKLSIHLKHIYNYTHLFEINSHSLFSKWFSESGKLVLKLFSNIREVAEHKGSFVIILIDEVESIAYARDSVAANEPSDSLRVVNAVLTQLDQLRMYSNILILTTSNLTATIDFAFIDRADLKQFIGEPSAEAIYEIYLMAINELILVNVITNRVELLPFDEAFKSAGEDKRSAAFLEIVQLSHGFSGRALRKMPFLAHAWFIRTEQTTFEEYLCALRLAVIKHTNDSKSIANK